MSERDELSRAAQIAGLQVQDVVVPTDEFVSINGLRLHYLDWGSPDKRTILFLHGTGVTAHSFDLVCLALHQDYHCIALDARGRGDSEWSPTADYHFESYAGDVAALVRHLGLKDFVLVGMSQGGTTAITYAGTCVSQPAALVVIDIGPHAQIAGAQRKGAFLSTRPERDSIEDFVADAKAFYPFRDEEMLRRDLRWSFRQTADGKWTWKFDTRKGPAFDPVAADRFLWDAIGNTRCPTLVVRGGESDIFSQENANELASRYPNGRTITIPRAGNEVQGDNPADLVKGLRAFFAEVLPQA